MGRTLKALDVASFRLRDAVYDPAQDTSLQDRATGGVVALYRRESFGAELARRPIG